jgi:hypothetical protein
MTSGEGGASSDPAASSRAPRERAGAGFTPAQASPTLRRRSEEGGSRGKHGLPRASSAGRLNAPRAALVESTFDGSPRVVNRQLVALVREEWRVVDRWWTEEPIDRRYFDVVLEGGQNVCVYRDQELAAWFTQKA